jgi:protein gp37
MAGKTSIEWTTHNWNPVRGCSRVSEGCRFCYAETLAARFSKPGQWGRGLAFWATRPDGKKEARWTGEVMAAPDHVLTEPLRWKKPRTIFVNSTSDLFHEDLPDEVIDRVFAVMALCPQHTFQILTKRPDRMRAYFAERRVGDPWAEGVDYVADLLELAECPVVIEPHDLPLPNVWLGTSLEDQATADARIPHLLATPAAIRFISAEPLLGPVDLRRIDDRPWPEELGARQWTDALLGATNIWVESRQGGWGGVAPGKIDWVICGGESGPGARPMHPDWARSLRDQCTAAGVPFFFKQWGAWAPDTGPVAPGNDPIAEGRYACAVPLSDGWKVFESGFPDRAFADPAIGEWMYRLGKGKAGRQLDGVIHDAMPATDQAVVPEAQSGSENGARA